MRSVNKCIILGTLGRDPEIRATQAGKQIGNLSVATSESWKDKNTGEWQERTEWHRIVIYSEPLAKAAGEKLRKGDQVYLEGQVETRKWTDQSGQERYSTEIVLRPYSGTMIVLPRQAKQDSPDKAQQGPVGGGFDQEIPFAPCK